MKLYKRKLNSKDAAKELSKYAMKKHGTPTQSDEVPAQSDEVPPKKAKSLPKRLV